MFHALELRIVRSAAGLLALAILLGCSGGGSDNEGEPTCADPFSTQLSGVWSIAETFGSTQPDCAGQESYDVTLTQQGSQLIWQREGVGTVPLTLCGRLITIPAEARQLDRGLVMAIGSHGAQFDSETHFTSTATFSIVVGANGSPVCQGQVLIEGTRQ